ncbi:hypothetical protein JCM10212_000762 [Sporobolomyces blumeae]
MSNSFAESELRTALAEVPWGVSSAEIRPPLPDGTATALVELLEGNKVLVGCSERGWCLLPGPGVRPSDAALDRRPFETLDDLLVAVSPAFESNRIQRLLSKLDDVAAESRSSSNDPPAAPSEHDDLDVRPYVES